MPLYTPPCASCQHFDRTRRDVERCTAFPDGIPDDIRFGRDDHRLPYEGDHGIRWALRPRNQGPDPV
jgi:hypothetical protein